MKYGVVSVILTVLAGTGMAAPSRQQGMTTAEATREIGTLQSLAQGNMKLTQAEATELDGLLKSFVGNLHQRDVQAGPLDAATGAVGGVLNGATGALSGVTGEVGKALGGLDLGDLGKTLTGLLSGSGGDAKSKRDVQAGPLDAATGALNGVTGEVGKALGGLDLGDLGKTLGDVLGPVLSSLQKAKPLSTRSTEAGPLDAVTGTVGGALNGATGAVNGLTGALGNTLGGLLGGKKGLDLSSILSSLTGNNKEVIEGLMKMGVTQHDVNMAVQHYNKQIAQVHKRSTEAGPLDAATGAVGGALNAATDALGGATNTVGNVLSSVTGLLGSLSRGGLDLGSVLGSLTGNNKQVVEGLMKMGVTQNDVNIAVQHYAKMAQQEKRSVEASPLDGILDALKKSGISLDDITKFLQGPAGQKIQEALAGLMKTQGGAAVMDEVAAMKAGLNHNDIAVLNKFAQHTAHMAKRASPPQGGSGSSDGAPDAAAPGSLDLSALLAALGKVTDNLPGGAQVSDILKSLGPVLSSLGKQ